MLFSPNTWFLPAMSMGYICRSNFLGGIVLWVVIQFTHSPNSIVIANGENPWRIDGRSFVRLRMAGCAHCAQHSVQLKRQVSVPDKDKST